MTVLLNFVLALLNTLVVAGIAHWATRRFTTVTEVRVAAFALAIGFVVGRFLTNQNASGARAVGGIVALFVIHHWLFRRANRIANG